MPGTFFIFLSRPRMQDINNRAALTIKTNIFLLVRQILTIYIVLFVSNEQIYEL